MKKFKYILLILLLMVSLSVFAGTMNSLIDVPLSMTLIFEIFITIHFSIFVLLPLSKLLSDNSKKIFKIICL